jgi:hypothetical protein
MNATASPNSVLDGYEGQERPRVFRVLPSSAFLRAFRFFGNNAAALKSGLFSS